MNYLEEFDESIIFAEPVDYKALGLLDYPMVVKRPMDLLTCRNRLASGKYQSFDQMNKDLFRIWENCRIYNQVGSEIVEQADIMEKHHNAYLKENPLSLPIPQKRHRESSEAEEVPFELKVLLAEQIRKSPQETILKILNLIESTCKSAVKKLGDHIRIKFDKVDKVTFDAISQ